MHTYSKVSWRFFSYVNLKWLVSAFMYTNIFSTGNNNRYLTIPNVVYITIIPPIVCICLITLQREVRDPPSQPPGMTWCTALNVDSHFFFIAQQSYNRNKRPAHRLDNQTAPHWTAHTIGCDNNRITTQTITLTLNTKGNTVLDDHLNKRFLWGTGLLNWLDRSLLHLID